MSWACPSVLIYFLKLARCRTPFWLPLDNKYFWWTMTKHLVPYVAQKAVPTNAVQYMKEEPQFTTTPSLSLEAVYQYVVSSKG